MDPYITLGIPSTSSQQDITKAWRKQMMAHHPDRGGDRNKFEAANLAYETLKNAGWKWAPPRAQQKARTNGFDHVDPIWAEHVRRQQRENINDIFKDLKESRTGDRTVLIPVQQAMTGAQVQVANVNITFPAGVPHGFKKKQGLVIATVNLIMPAGYRIRGLGDTALGDAGINIGDTELTVKVNALKLITGGWLKVNDFLGKELEVRIPAGFDPKNRLKIAGRGYSAWLKEFSKPSEKRADMYVRVVPEFTPPHAIPRDIINSFVQVVS